MSANTGIPTLVGFCGGRAADGMPAFDTGVVAEAVSELTRAFANQPPPEASSEFVVERSVSAQADE